MKNIKIKNINKITARNLRDLCDDHLNGTPISEIESKIEQFSTVEFEGEDGSFTAFPASDELYESFFSKRDGVQKCLGFYLEGYSVNISNYDKNISCNEQGIYTANKRSPELFEENLDKFEKALDIKKNVQRTYSLSDSELRLVNSDFNLHFGRTGIEYEKSPITYTDMEFFDHEIIRSVKSRSLNIIPDIYERKSKDRFTPDEITQAFEKGYEKKNEYLKSGKVPPRKEKKYCYYEPYLEMTLSNTLHD